MALQTKSLHELASQRELRLCQLPCRFPQIRPDSSSGLDGAGCWMWAGLCLKKLDVTELAVSQLIDLADVRADVTRVY